MSVRGKKLLHVGGALYQVPAIKCAKENGCIVILVDQDENVPGREYADVFELVSTTDLEGILQVAKRHQIDGIMTSASDSSTPSVAYVAHEMKLAGNLMESAQVLQAKDLFRKLQEECGIDHPAFRVVTELDEAIKGGRELGFPIVFKPVDSAGTKGQSVVYREDEISAAFRKAISFSKASRVIMETFLRGDMMELDGDVLVKDGVLAFRHYGHNHFMKNRISNVPCGEIFPGFFGPDVAEKLDAQFSAIIKKLGLRTGCMNFDGVVSGGKVIILDIGLRNGGNFVPEAIQLSTGFDLLKAALYSALGQDFNVPFLASPDPHPVATYLVASRVGGELEEVSFSEELKPYIKEYRPFFNPGDSISPYTRSDLAMGCLFLQFPDMKTLKDRMDRIENLVTIRSKGSNSLVAEDPDIVQTDPNAFRKFKEIVSPFLKAKLAEAKASGNEDVVRVLTKQYIEPPNELDIRMAEGLKHYEASAEAYFEGKKLAGLERLYSRVMLFEPLEECMAHCRFCIRRNYEHFTQSPEDVKRAARFVGMAKGHEELREILVTGGDPFLVPNKVEMFLDGIAEHVPQIKVARIATRVPIHEPGRVNDKVINMLSKKYPFAIEVATQINHAAELFPEVEAAYRRILSVVRVVYNQTVLLRGVNDSKEELVEVCDRIRNLGIENHYLFPCVPIGGLNHFRVPLMRAIELGRQLSSSGRISGRAKPKLCFMTSIGKITPYEGTIVSSSNNRYLLKSDYSYEERMSWNPHWKLPKDAEISKDGYLCVWYEDAR